MYVAAMRIPRSTRDDRLLTTTPGDLSKICARRLRERGRDRSPERVVQ